GRAKLPPELGSLEYALMASGRSGRLHGATDLAYTQALVAGLAGGANGRGRATDRLGNVTPATLHSHAVAAQAVSEGRPQPIFRCLLREDFALARAGVLTKDDLDRVEQLFYGDGWARRVPVGPDHEVAERF